MKLKRNRCRLDSRWSNCEVSWTELHHSFAVVAVVVVAAVVVAVVAAVAAVVVAAVAGRLVEEAVTVAGPADQNLGVDCAAFPHASIWHGDY